MIVSVVREILAGRSLIRELVLRDLKLRYSRPLLGILWMILSPLLAVAVFYLIFGVFLNVRTTGTPFVLYLMAGIFPWRFFQESLMSSATSLIDNKNLIRESGFAHYFIPLSIVLANMVNFLPALLILLTAAIVFKGLTFLVLLLPGVLLVHFFITFGLAVMASVFYIRFRDIKYILELMLLLLFYLTPVFYTLELVRKTLPTALFKAYVYNPFTLILILYRTVFLKDFYGSIQGNIGIIPLVLMPAIFSVLILWSGLFFYKKQRTRINDYLYY